MAHQERPDGGKDTLRIVAKPGSCRAQMRRKQTGQVNLPTHQGLGLPISTGTADFRQSYVPSVGI